MARDPAREAGRVARHCCGWGRESDRRRASLDLDVARLCEDFEELVVAEEVEPADRG